MNRYRKGYLAERMVMTVLRGMGYSVFRSAGSHSPVDVVAVNRSFLLLSQVKSTKRKLFYAHILPKGFKLRNLETMIVPDYTKKLIWIKPNKDRYAMFHVYEWYPQEGNWQAYFTIPWPKKKSGRKQNNQQPPQLLPSPQSSKPSSGEPPSSEQ